MEVVRRLTGTAVADERPLAGRIVGWMFVVGAVLTTLLPLLPGAEGAVLTPTLPIGVAAFFWGLYAALKMDWRSAPGWAMHASVGTGMACVAVAVHDTGGVDSPARFLIALCLIFSAFFFSTREAWPYFALALVVHALPLTYDSEAVANALLGELLILVPCYWLVAFLLLTGKRQMVELRTEADRLAREDPLTGIANRRALVEAISAATGMVGLLTLDVDDFKGINTSTGIPAATGPSCSWPRRCAPPRASRTCRPASAATSSRCWPPASTPPAWRSWPSASMSEIRYGDIVRISAGWVVGRADPQQLLLEADEALRAAKRGGKNRALSYS